MACAASMQVDNRRRPQTAGDRVEKATLYPNTTELSCAFLCVSQTRRPGLTGSKKRLCTPTTIDLSYAFSCGFADRAVVADRPQKTMACPTRVISAVGPASRLRGPEARLTFLQSPRAVRRLEDRAESVRGSDTQSRPFRRAGRPLHDLRSRFPYRQDQRRFP